MFRKRIDVVFSVAEEDLDIAKQINERLKKRKMSTYLYDEHNIVGESIFRTTLDMYRTKGKILLMIISKHFPNKFWTRVERLVAQAFRRKRMEYIIPVRLDDTIVNGISDDTAYIKWKNNPDAVVQTIMERLVVINKKNREKKAIYTGAIALALLITIITVWQQIKHPATIGYIRNIHFIPAKDSIERGKDSIPNVYQADDPRKQVVDFLPVKKDLVIEGTITDSHTGELLDSVIVNINGNKFMAENGFFKFQLKEVEPDKDLEIRYHYTKPGYKSESFHETPYVKSSLTTHRTSANMNKQE